MAFAFFSFYGLFPCGSGVMGPRKIKIVRLRIFSDLNKGEKQQRLWDTLRFSIFLQHCYSVMAVCILATGDHDCLFIGLSKY